MKVCIHFFCFFIHFIVVFWIWNADIINTEGNDHNYDSVEIYFDGDNSKSEAYDGFDDLQLRFNVGETELGQIDIGFGSDDQNWDFVRDGIAYVIRETHMDWDLKVCFNIDNLKIAQSDEFGFDIQLNDADESTRGNNMIRWWSDSNDEGQNVRLTLQASKWKIEETKILNHQKRDFLRWLCCSLHSFF